MWYFLRKDTAFLADIQILRFFVSFSYFEHRSYADVVFSLMNRYVNMICYSKKLRMAGSSPV